MAGITRANFAAQHRASAVAKLHHHIFSTLCALHAHFHEDLEQWMAYHLS